MWEKFKLIRIGASIDGYGKVQEYQRYPSKWSAIEKNLQKIDSMPQNISAWIAFTVTNINVYHVPEFISWKLQQNFKKINKGKTKIITHHVCHKPWYSSIRVLPSNTKKDITAHYEYWKEKFGTYDDNTKKRACSILDSISNYMNAKDESDKLSNFVEYTKKLDTIRNQSILDIVPQYKDIFDEK